MDNINNVTIWNLVGIFISLLFGAASFASYVRYYKNKIGQFDNTIKLFSKWVKVENYYFNNRVFSWQWNRVIINTCVCFLVLPLAVFVPLSYTMDGDTTYVWMWLIVNVVIYFISLLSICLYYKKVVFPYTSKVEESKGTYVDLKNIDIEIVKDFNFTLIFNDKPVVRNQPIQHNFKVFLKRYRARGDNSFQQYRVLMNFLNRFSSMIGTMSASSTITGYGLENYTISTTEGKQIPCTKENFALCVVTRMQSLVHSK